MSDNDADHIAMQQSMDETQRGIYAEYESRAAMYQNLPGISRTDLGPMAFGHGGGSAQAGFVFNTVGRQDYGADSTGDPMLYLGDQKAGTGFNGLLGQGKAINPEYAQRAQYGEELWSVSSAKNFEAGTARTQQYLESIDLEANPWGEGQDAAAARKSFEKQFLANDAAALADFTQLQLREYGGVYKIAGDVERTQVMKPAGDGETQLSNKETQFYAMLGPKNDLSAIEQYKLQRYNMRNIQTGKAIGSGMDDYNPIGLSEEDRFVPGEFAQETAEYAPVRLADRAAKQVGKDTFTKKPKAAQAAAQL